jgi:hypothetical protein
VFLRSQVRNRLLPSCACYYKPELGNDSEVLTLHNAFIDGPFHSLSRLNLVAVIAGAVKQTVASLDGVVDLICAGVIVHLPQAEAN